MAAGVFFGQPSRARAVTLHARVTPARTVWKCLAPVLPARELLANLLLEAKDPAALQAYEASLKTEPNRFRSILGKARAAKAVGDSLETSREAYKRLATLSALADSDRPELAEAKTFVSN